MRHARLPFGTRKCLAVGIAAAAWAMAFHSLAQPSQPAVNPAESAPTLSDPASPQAPTAPLRHQPMAASGTIVAQPGDWKEANAAVADFPRGHADVIRWEKDHAAMHDRAAGEAHVCPHHPQHHRHNPGGQP
ncbi:hypothetical protein [Comamonas sp. 4034]|uniref:hypothetical protein n=1 Tax=Comamonas sp. 4034 TaxID=3156455 RepID=UPI00320BBF05